MNPEDLTGQAVADYWRAKAHEFYHCARLCRQERDYVNAAIWQQLGDDAMQTVNDN